MTTLAYNYETLGVIFFQMFATQQIEVKPLQLLGMKISHLFWKSNGNIQFALWQYKNLAQINMETAEILVGIRKQSLSQWCRHNVDVNWRLFLGGK